VSYYYKGRQILKNLKTENFPLFMRKPMITEQQIRQRIRQILEEVVNNFLESQPETKTRQLKDNSKPEELGDPISDIEMNQRANETGSDSTSPTVSVKPGATQNGSDFTTGQKKANFSDKTKQAK
jgi:hypothetical protein